MSKDSWFRGALLSALFFGLVAGPLPAQSSRPSTAPEIGVPGTGGTVTPTSVAVSSSTNYYRAHAMARELKGMCDCLASVGFHIEVVAYTAMIVGVALALATVISGGVVGIIALPVGALLSVVGAVLGGASLVKSWCSNTFAPWYALNFG